MIAYEDIWLIVPQIDLIWNSGIFNVWTDNLTERQAWDTFSFVIVFSLLLGKSR